MIDKTKDNVLDAQILNMEWERIFLFVTVKIDCIEEYKGKQFDFYLVNGLFKAKGKPKLVSENNNEYTVKINITNNGEKRCYPLGTYKLCVCYGDIILGVAYPSQNVVKNVDLYSRNFLYANRKKIYTVTFFIDEDNDTFYHNPLYMYVMPSASCDMNSQLRGGVKRALKGFVKSGVNYCTNKRLLYKRLYNKTVKAKPLDNEKKTVLFMTEQSDKLGANLQAVLDRMIKRGLESEFTILTSARPASYVEQSEKSWNELIKIIAKSDIIFVDDHAPVFDWLILDSKTKVIQLWHAGAGFKSSGYSRWGHKGCPGPFSAHRQYSYGIAGSKNIIPFFSEVWGINDEQVLPTGMPRMDEYLDKTYRLLKTQEIYSQFEICRNKKVILFAPTYRGKNRKEAYYPYHLIDFERLYNVCKGEYVVLFKMHPWVSEAVPIDEKYSDVFIDVGKYPNINDLFYITDLLITDYSSNIFEYSLMGNPMLFFAFDKTEYSFSRGFHRDYESSAPGKVCYTFNELVEAIETKDFEQYKVREYVNHHFDYIDSNSSDRVIDWLLLDRMPENLREELDNIEKQNIRLSQLDFSPSENEQ